MAVLYKMDAFSGIYFFQTLHYQADQPFKAPSNDPERVFSILNFPLEITRMILVLILKPGTVYPQVGHQYDSSSDADARVSPPGFQTLATCKLNYNIGFPIFYGDNEFYLPRGPEENADAYFSSLVTGYR